MEEFFEAWTEWKETKYHTREHRGLKDAGEKWVTPISLFENGERYEKAAPPREYAAMLLMKADTALVRNQGITKFGTLYTDYELLSLCRQTRRHQVGHRRRHEALRLRRGGPEDMRGRLRRAPGLRAPLFTGGA